MNCPEVEDALHAYALGALDEDEAGHVEAHVATCTECRRRLEEAAAIAHDLPLGLSNASPFSVPPDLRERVIRAAASASPTASVRLAGAGHAEDRPSSHEPAEGPGWATGVSVGLRRAMQWARFTRRSWAVVVALLGLVTLGSLLWGAGLSLALDRERALRERVEAFYIRQQEVVLEVVDSSETVRRILLPPEGSGAEEAYGKLFTRRDMSEVVAVLGRMPQPPAGQRYRLWLMERGKEIDAGVVSVDGLGFGLVVFEAARAGPLYEVVEVRREPSEAEAGSGEIVLRWEGEAAGA